MPCQSIGHIPPDFPQRPEQQHALDGKLFAAQIALRHGGNMSEVLKAIFTDPENPRAARSDEQAVRWELKSMIEHHAGFAAFLGNDGSQGSQAAAHGTLPPAGQPPLVLAHVATLPVAKHAERALVQLGMLVRSALAHSPAQSATGHRLDGKLGHALVCLARHLPEMPPELLQRAAQLIANCAGHLADQDKRDLHVACARLPRDAAGSLATLRAIGESGEQAMHHAAAQAVDRRGRAMFAHQGAMQFVEKEIRTCDGEISGAASSEASESTAQNYSTQTQTEGTDIATGSLAGLTINKKEDLSLSQKVLLEFSKTFEINFENFSKNESLSNSQKSLYLTPSNMFMAVVLDSLNKAYKKIGQPIVPSKQVPDDLNEVLGNAIDYALSTQYSMFVSLDDPEARISDGSLNFLPRANQALDLLYSFPSNTPFGKIPAQNRWKMCIDPVKVAALKELGIDTENNPLLGFMFESLGEDEDEMPTPYLYGMAQGWHYAMNNLNSPITWNLIIGLYQACTSESGARYSFDDHVGISYTLTLNHPASMTKAGIKEMDDDGMEIRQTYPYYSMGLSSEELQELLDREETENIDIKEELDDVDFSKAEEVKVIRLPSEEDDALKKTIDGWLKKYEQKIRLRPEKVRESVVELCQKISRLHPFTDATARAFAIILPNLLLASAGKNLMMVDDPNLFSGSSRAEGVAQTRKGEERVRQEFYR